VAFTCVLSDASKDATVSMDARSASDASAGVCASSEDALIAVLFDLLSDRLGGSASTSEDSVSAACISRSLYMR
jgi:hypothetical protein